MAADLQIVPAHARHIRAVASRMRQADRDEVMAGTGKTPVQALSFSLRRSVMARTVLLDGRPEMIFGVGDLNILAGIGAPWLLGTDAIDRHYVYFLRTSIEWRDQLLRDYSVLRNFVDDRNDVSKRWLAWLGFQLSEPFPYRGHLFRLFELRSQDV